jgi:hypothetical protein
MSGTFNPNDMELTPAILTIYPYGVTAASAAFNLGATLGNIKIAIKTDKAPFHADQTGSTPLDMAISGQQYTITTEIAQTRDYLLAASAIFPHMQLAGSSPYNGTAPSGGLVFVNAVGAKDSAVAIRLNLHPQDIAIGNQSYDFTFPKVCATEASEIDFSPNKQSTWKLVFTVYPDIANPYSASGTNYTFMVRGNQTYL